MSHPIDWTDFNNQLLERIKTEEKGPFYDLFMTCVEMQPHLGQGSKKDLPYHTIEWNIPQNLENYGKGDIGFDMEIINYFNDCIKAFYSDSNMLKKLSDKNSFNPLKWGNPFEEITWSPSLTWKSQPPEIKNIPSRFHKDIQMYLVLIRGLYRYYNGDRNRLPEETSYKGISGMDSENDFYFLGSAAMLNRQFFRQGNHSNLINGRSFLNIEVNPVHEEENKNNPDFILPRANLLINLTGDPHNYLLTIFKSINDGNTLFRKSTRTINEMLPALLSSSSFIWQGKLGADISREELESMTEEQRTELLLGNKSEILTRCFEELAKNFPDSNKTQKQEILNKLLLPAKVMHELLIKIERKRIERQFVLKKAGNLKKHLISLSSDLGENEASATRDILKLLGEFEVDIPHLKEGSVIQKTLKNYQILIIEETKMRLQITSLEDKLSEERSKLEALFSTLRDLIQKEYFDKRKYGHSVLQVYTTFSFVLLNKDLFPSVSLKKEVGSRKIPSILKKQTLRSFFERWKEKKAFSPINLFREIINGKAESLFTKFQRPHYPLKMQSLTKEQMGIIIKTTNTVHEALESGKKEGVSQFLKVENAILRLMNEDNVLVASLIDSGETDRESIMALYAHIEACLYFADPKSEREISPRNKGFSTLFENVIKTVRKDNISKTLEKEGKYLQDSIKNLSLPSQNLSSSLEKDVNSVSFDQLQYKKLHLKRQVVGVNPNLEKLKRLYGSITENLEDFLYRGRVGGYDLELLYSDQEVPAGNLSEDKIKKHFSQDDWNFISRLLPRPVSRREGIESLKAVIIDNYFPLQEAKSSLSNWDPRKDDKLLLGAFSAQILKNKIDQLEGDSLQYELVSNPDPLEPNMVNIFQDRTFFTAFGQGIIENQQSEKIAEEAYWEFLPLFIASFIRYDDTQVDQSFKDLKMDLIKSLPGADVVYADLRKWMNANQKKIQALDEWLEQETQKNVEALQGDSGAISAFIERISKEARERFGVPIGNFMNGLKEFTLISTILSGGILASLAKAGLIAGGMGLMGSVIASVIMGFSLGGVYMGYGRPYGKALITKIIENYQYYFTQEFSKTSPNTYLLKILMSAINNEIGAFDSPKELPEKLQTTNYLQGFFNTVEISKNNLMAFPTRIFQLIPNSVENGSFSTLALNFFYMLNKDAFQLLPPEILQRASHPLFKEAVKEYLSKYVSELTLKEDGFTGNLNLAEIRYDQETELSRYLKEKAQKGEITLSFSSSSAVGKVLNKRERFTLNEDQILPYKGIDPDVLSENLGSILDCFKEILTKRDLMKAKLNPIFQEFADKYDSIPLSQSNTNQAIQGLVDSVQMLRIGFELSTNLVQINDYSLVPRYSTYLQATKENAVSIFNSPTISDTMKVLSKTSQFASGQGYESGIQIERSLKELQTIIDNYITHGAYYPLPHTFWSNLQNNVLSIAQEIDQGKGSLAYPVMIELSQNNNLLMPLISFNMLKEHLFSLYGNKGGMNVIQNLNNSKISYLTGENLSIYFFDATSRGFSLSPFMMNAIEKTAKGFQNKSLKKFMGRIGNLQTNMLPLEEGGMAQESPWNRQSNPMRLHPGQNYIRPYQATKALPYAEDPLANPVNNQNMIQNQPQPEAYRPNQQVDPNVIPQESPNTFRNPPQQNVQGPIEGVVNPNNPQTNRFRNPNVLEGANRQNRDQVIDPNIEDNPLDVGVLAGSSMLAGTFGNALDDPEDEGRLENIENKIMGTENQEKQMIVQNVGSSNSYINEGHFLGKEENFRNPNAHIDLEPYGGNNPYTDPEIPYDPEGSFPLGGGIYNNLSRRRYEEQAPQDLAQSFPWKKALGIGGGAILGAGLLASMFSGDEPSEKKKKNRKT
jgi:hypothetical protein